MVLMIKPEEISSNTRPGLGADKALEELGGIVPPKARELKPGRNPHALKRQIEKLERQLELDRATAKRLRENCDNICYMGQYNDKADSLASLNAHSPLRVLVCNDKFLDDEGVGTNVQRLLLSLRDSIRALFRRHDESGFFMVTLETGAFVTSTIARTTILPFDLLASALRVACRDKTIHYHWAVGKIQLSTFDPLERRQILYKVSDGLEKRARTTSEAIDKLRDIYRNQFSSFLAALNNGESRTSAQVAKGIMGLGDNEPILLSGESMTTLEDLSIFELERLSRFLESKRESVLRGELVDATKIDPRYTNVNHEILEMQRTGTRGLVEVYYGNYCLKVQNLIEERNSKKS